MSNPTIDGLRREDSLMWAIRFYEGINATHEDALAAAEAFHAYVYGADK